MTRREQTPSPTTATAAILPAVATPNLHPPPAAAAAAAVAAAAVVATAAASVTAGTSSVTGALMTA